jgi:hypothetical protein
MQRAGENVTSNKNKGGSGWKLCCTGLGGIRLCFHRFPSQEPVVAKSRNISRLLVKNIKPGETEFDVLSARSQECTEFSPELSKALVWIEYCPQFLDSADTYLNNEIAFHTPVNIHPTYTMKIGLDFNPEEVTSLLL